MKLCPTLVTVKLSAVSRSIAVTDSFEASPRTPHSIMTTNRAAVLPTKQARPFEITMQPIPKPGPTEVLIRVHALAINPVDAGVQALGFLWTEYPLILGSDVAGSVVSVGSDVRDRVQEGDRIMACLEQGGFQEYCVADVKMVVRIPESVSFVHACVVPLGCVTAMMSLFHPESVALDVPRVDGNESNGKTVVIWGSSSSVGSSAVQMAKAAGYEVVATAGAQNIEYSKGLGVSRVFDYRSEGAVEEIITYIDQPGKQFAGIFCAATLDAATIARCAVIAGRLGKDAKSRTIATVMAPGMPFDSALLPEGVTLDFCAGMADILPDSKLRSSMGYSALRPNSVAEDILGKGMWLEHALANGTFKCKPDAHVVGEGLEHVQEACDRIAGGISAAKVVVEIP